MLKVTLSEQLSRIIKLSEEIQDLIEGDEEFNADFEKNTDIVVRIRKEITVLEDFISQKEKRPSSPSSESTSSSSSVSVNEPVNSSVKSTVRLPKLEIKKYNGDPTAWKTFYESFLAAVDKNNGLENIEKMNFLISYLEGEAENVIKVLQLSNENYRIALEMLKSRFGDTQVLITAHMSKLLSLGNVPIFSDVKGLRTLYDEVETQVRSLQNLGLDPENYGPMLTPILLQKLPDDLKLIISRHFGKAAWDIEKLLECFNNELGAREKIQFENNNAEHAEIPFTGSSLYTGGVQRRFQKFLDQSAKNKRFEKNDMKKCIFCGRNHISRNCGIVTKPEARKNVLIKEKRCFKCLKIGHSAFKCRTNITCFKCEGHHHTCVCTFSKERRRDGKKDEKGSQEEFREQNNTSNNLVNVSKKNSVLLQTAQAQVTSTDEKQAKKARLLFDTGSQLTYISPKTRQVLKLPAIGKQTVVVKSFGKSESTKRMDVVQFAVKSRDRNLNIYVKALVSDMCQPVEQQIINVAKESFVHLKGLPLADSNPANEPLEIDILIGADHYWDFIQNRVVRGKTGPVALASQLGYILSGEIGDVPGIYFFFSYIPIFF